MIKKSTNIEYYFVTALIIFSFLLRFVSIYFVRDIQIENEWAVLLNNLINYNSYSLNSFEGQLIPSVFMPPLYPFFLYFIKSISFLKDSNLGILCSKEESLPNSILEYLSYKIPVISSNVGGCREIIKNKRNGLLLKKNNSLEL